MQIHKKSLAQNVGEQLIEQINSGKYSPGDKLPTESELMRIFGVGRSSIREAIRALSNIGMVNVRQGAGTFVSAQSVSNIGVDNKMRSADRHELEEVRKILEIAIVEKTVARRTDGDIKKMRELLRIRKNHAINGLLEDCMKTDMDFHIAVADATHNTLLAEIYRSASTRLLAAFNEIYEDTSCFIQSQPSHEKLLKYIMDGDLKNARKMAVQVVEEP